MAEYKQDEERDGLNVSNISGKRKIIRAVLRWTTNVTGLTKEQKYLWTLKNQCESLDIGEINNQFKKMEEWCAYRNEIIHALMNKNVLSVNQELKDRVLEGMEIARYFDSQLKILKKGNKIRKSANLPEK